MQRIRIKFSKGPEVKFTSHLDVIRCFERAIRRTDIPVSYSSGFNPRMRIAWGPPLALGIESICEMADMDIEGWVKPNAVLNKLNSVLPEGFGVIDAKLDSPTAPSLASSMNRAEYIAEIEAADAAGLKRELEEILIRQKLEFVVKEKVVDKKPLLHGLSLSDDDSQVKMLVEVGNRGTLKPAEILGLLKEAKIKKIKRVNLFVS